MEKEILQKENEEIRKAIRDLQRELSLDLTQGYYYGMEQKIRSIQKTLALSVRV